MRKRFANPVAKPFRPTPFDLAPHVPTRHDVELAARARDAFPYSPFPKSGEFHIRIASAEGERVVTLPFAAVEMLRRILMHMARGRSLSVLPCRTSLTTSQAADFLEMSRPHLVSLLEAGEIPFWKAGTHRRVLLQDVVDYRRRKQRESGREDSGTAEQRALR